MYSESELDAIDASVARHVMGWQVHVHNTAWWVTTGEENGITKGPKAMTCGTDRFHPTRSWSDAGEVVERMRKRDVPFECAIHTSSVGFKVTIFSPSGSNWTANEKEMPLALTLAALTAVGHPWKGTT